MRFLLSLASAILILLFAQFANTQESEHFDRMIESVIAPALIEKNRSESIDLPDDVRTNLNSLKESVDAQISQMGDILFSELGSRAPATSEGMAEEYTYFIEKRGVQATDQLEIRYCFCTETGCGCCEDPPGFCYSIIGD